MKEKTVQDAPFRWAEVANVFAVGDVRAGSVKRVGAAIGEGAAAVAQIHTVLSNASVPPPTAREQSEADERQLAPANHTGTIAGPL